MARTFLYTFAGTFENFRLNSSKSFRSAIFPKRENMLLAIHTHKLIRKNIYSVVPLTVTLPVSEW